MPLGPSQYFTSTDNLTIACKERICQNCGKITFLGFLIDIVCSSNTWLRKAIEL